MAVWISILEHPIAFVLFCLGVCMVLWQIQEW